MIRARLLGNLAYLLLGPRAILGAKPRKCYDVFSDCFDVAPRPSCSEHSQELGICFDKIRSGIVGGEDQSEVRERRCPSRLNVSVRRGKRQRLPVVLDRSWLCYFG